MSHDARGTWSLAACSQARTALEVLRKLYLHHGVHYWVSRPESFLISLLPFHHHSLSAPLPFSPQWLPSRSGLIMHTSLTVPTVSEYQVSSAACLGFVPGNRNPNHTVRGFILLPWIQYTTLWQERTHLEKNRLYTRMWTCHKIHFSFQLKLPLLKRSHYHAVSQHKAQQKKKATTVRLGDGRRG